ncbi:hypothetical protein DFH07DRAFT_563512 [Mycena maculata]|uniref:Uncharacterized protein n=1 Tax=Mycena maculata TaxID=230809 RepID=A0AAD7N749_9AGAR|nr:hypothetical protein DFH07DRAFT_563512 [Mycena maculata]
MNFMCRHPAALSTLSIKGLRRWIPTHLHTFFLQLRHVLFYLQQREFFHKSAHPRPILSLIVLRHRRSILAAIFVSAWPLLFVVASAPSALASAAECRPTQDHLNSSYHIGMYHQPERNHFSISAAQIGPMVAILRAVPLPHPSNSESLAVHSLALHRTYSV